MLSVCIFNRKRRGHLGLGKLPAKPLPVEKNPPGLSREVTDSTNQVDRYVTDQYLMLPNLANQKETRIDHQYCLAQGLSNEIGNRKEQCIYELDTQVQITNSKPSAVQPRTLCQNKNESETYELGVSSPRNGTESPTECNL